MESKIYYGELTAHDLADALVGRFDDPNLQASKSRSGEQVIVQIASRQFAKSGGKTSIGVVIQNHEDGVLVKLGKQSWLGIAASLGQTLLAAKANPFNLIGRLDDVAQDIENLSLDDQIWAVVDQVAKTMGASQTLSERLRRTGCLYCDTANPVGQPRCIACGAPLGDAQPTLCPNCGYVAADGDTTCDNCGHKL